MNEYSLTFDFILSKFVFGKSYMNVAKLMRTKSKL